MHNYANIKSNIDLLIIKVKIYLNIIMEGESNKDKNKNRTLTDQQHIENVIKKIFQENGFDLKTSENYDQEVDFNYYGHFNFAKQHIPQIPRGNTAIAAGMPWFSYWILNVLDMLTKNCPQLSHDSKLKFIPFLEELQHPEGGFCGYPSGMQHVVSNYAAVMAIMALGIEEGYKIINRDGMKKFLRKLKVKNKENYLYDSRGNYVVEQGDGITGYKVHWPGSYQMHENGESDLRATYCALTVAYVLNILDDELIEGVVDNIKLCQTFEGGLGPEPYCEAHGGYSFCGIATLVILNKLEEINTRSFLRWLVNKQMRHEGGFQGRTNKLVDSCYSFWQGAVFNLLVMSDKKYYSHDKELLYDQLALQAYILFACQNEGGGLMDKPGKRPDLFHTNYATAGLSLSQENILTGDYKILLSANDSLDIESINPIFCVTNEKVKKAQSYFSINKIN
jgi:protein farnesyltransferase subunit beta